MDSSGGVYKQWTLGGPWSWWGLIFDDLNYYTINSVAIKFIHYIIWVLLTTTALPFKPTRFLFGYAVYRKIHIDRILLYKRYDASCLKLQILVVDTYKKKYNIVIISSGGTIGFARSVANYILKEAHRCSKKG